jgi:hypothetical protein
MSDKVKQRQTIVHRLLSIVRCLLLHYPEILHFSDEEYNAFGIECKERECVDDSDDHEFPENSDCEAIGSGENVREKEGIQAPKNNHKSEIGEREFPVKRNGADLLPKKSNTHHGHDDPSEHHRVDGG